MVLVMILLAGFLLAGIARHSLLDALAAMEARQDLQRRWGSISCERALLDRAELLFGTLAAGDAAPADEQSVLSALAVRLALGGLHFDVRLADENCKVNLNAVFAYRGPDAATRLCREMGGADLPLPVRLRPSGAGADGQQRVFDSWGQVFDLVGDDAQGLSPKSVADATAQLTCWGDGTLNFQRAPDAALRAVARLAVGAKPADELLKLRRRHPGWGAARCLNALGVDGRARQKLGRFLADRSGCQSLWIVVSAPERAWHELVVVESLAQDERQVSRFLW